MKHICGKTVIPTPILISTLACMFRDASQKRNYVHRSLPTAHGVDSLSTVVLVLRRSVLSAQVARKDGFMKVMSRTLLLSSLIAASIATATPTASAAAAQEDLEDARAVPSAPDVMAKPDHVSEWQRGASTPTQRTLTQTCSQLSNSRHVCVAPSKPRGRAHAASSRVPVPTPWWCTESGGEVVSLSRTASCRITGMVLTTSETVNGTVRVTGEAFMDIWDYTYSSADLPSWVHQISVSPWESWGDAARASVTGTATAAGDCVSGASSFPAQSVYPDNDAPRSGEFAARTTATAIGAVGQCTTTWTLLFNTAGYPPASYTPDGMNDVACDNATGANGSRPARVGCVVWWFPATVNYSWTRNPELASHVSQAQASGLPGSGFANPLNRLTDEALIRVNRTRACGDAPSIAGKSCDEYPLASTRQGLAFGGSRRTFPGCNISAPTDATGPSGASACMINEGDNRAQGGIMAGFYYDNRVLDGDPFLVAVVP